MQPFQKPQDFLQFFFREEVVYVNYVVRRADTVQPPHPLNHTHRVPMQVVIHDDLGILQILSLGKHIRTDQEIDALVQRQVGFPIGFGSKPHDAIVALCWLHIAVHNGNAAMPQTAEEVFIVCELPVDVSGRVLEIGEHYNFLAGQSRRSEELFQRLQFVIPMFMLQFRQDLLKRAKVCHDCFPNCLNIVALRGEFRQSLDEAFKVKGFFSFGFVRGLDLKPPAVVFGPEQPSPVQCF